MRLRHIVHSFLFVTTTTLNACSLLPPHQHQIPQLIRHIDFQMRMLAPLPERPVPATEPLPGNSTDKSCALVETTRGGPIRTPTMEWVDPEEVLNNCLKVPNATSQTCCGTVVGDAAMQCIEFEHMLVQGTISVNTIPDYLQRICANPVLRRYIIEINSHSQILPLLP